MKIIDVVCGALIIDGKVMIARRNYGSAKGIYEFPGGKVESGETKALALYREWLEECSISISDIKYLASNIDHQDGYEIHLTCFTCTSKHVPTILKVHDDYIWTFPDEIYKYPFFKSDAILVETLKEKWECLTRPMK